MLYGVSRVTVNTVRGKPVNIVETFCGFTESFSDSIVLNLLQSIYVALWSLLFFVPGIIKSYAYSMAFYIQQENSNKSASDCLSESQKLMKGHKWQLFCLDLSFIGWYIVGSLCFGVGVFFVIPYHQTARANFYMALTAEEFIG